MYRLFRWKKRAKRLGHSCDAYCYDCKKQTPWKVGLLTKQLQIGKLSLPAIQKEYFMYCGACGVGIELSKQDFRAVALLQSSCSIPRSLLDAIEQQQLANKSQFHLQWLKSTVQQDKSVR